MEELIILGATGSIGDSCFTVCRDYSIKVKAIAIKRNVSKVIDIIKEFNIEYLGIFDEVDCSNIKNLFPNLKIGFGLEGVLECLNYSGDVVNAISGISGLIPTIRSLELSKKLYLANKESIVVAGEYIKKRFGYQNIIPLDSEHNGLYQLLKGINKDDVKNLIITASGGAFRDYTREQLQNVTCSDALNHPNWSMGSKITIDSATMVNKGLEVIEAYYLFDFRIENIKTVIHKESIIHAFITLNDNSVRALLYNPSMVIPIQNCLLNEFKKTNVSEINFETLGNLSFQKMDYKRFPMIELAYKVLELGGLYPTVYNASNEKAVELFLNSKISFLQIEKIIENSVNEFKSNLDEVTLDSIINTDLMIKEKIRGVYE